MTTGKGKNTYQLKKTGRKWLVTGPGKGWIFKRIFPTKWKAEVAMEVYLKGGRTSDYFEAAREEAEKRPPRTPHVVIKEIKQALDEISSMEPTCEEIVEYAKSRQSHYGVVTVTDSEHYFSPRLHDTWGEKRGGRVHIDMGCSNYHLMLDKDYSLDFIDFVKRRRGIR